MARQEASRRAGLARLAAFLPDAGAAYQARRNTDYGPGRPAAVSGLSAYLQRRLVGEPEVIAAVCRRHGATAAKSFLQEVLWRTYWKGWLEHHRGVWAHYVAARDAARAATGGAARAIAAAQSGRSGIACMDAWAAELVQDNTLHNHVRMWFASIWIFTLGLPWAAGADFFHRHLIDGDAASNTLGWRWVAGLQTSGKHYLARADNIARFTGGRFADVRGLRGDAPPLADDGAQGAAEDPGLPPPAQPPAGRLGLLLTPEDLSLETAELASWRVTAVAALGPAWVAAGLRSAAEVERFGRAACADALARAGGHWRAPTSELAGPPGPGGGPQAAVLAWARAAGLDAVALPAPRAGPWRDLLAPCLRELAAAGLRVVPVFRAHDLALFPWARRGFFHFKKHALWPATAHPEAPELAPPAASQLGRAAGR